MQLSFVLRTYAHFFYVTGQSLYNPLLKSYHWHVKALPFHHYTFIAAYFAIVAVLTVVGETLELQALITHDEKATPVLAIAVALAACSNFAAMFQCAWYPDSVETIHQLFVQVDHLFRKNLRRTVSYEPYRDVYRIKFTICILLCVINLIVVVTLNMVYGKEILITTLEMILMCISVLTNLHAVFYVGLHVFMQENFCKIVDSVSGANGACGEPQVDVLFAQPLNSRHIITNIQIYKIVHFKLWMASQMISEYFGWDIIFWYLQSFLDMTNSVFYLYIFAQNGHFAAGILRTYPYRTDHFYLLCSAIQQGPGQGTRISCIDRCLPFQSIESHCHLSSPMLCIRKLEISLGCQTQWELPT